MNLSMDSRQVEKILREYAKQTPDQPTLTEQDVAQLRTRLAEAAERKGLATAGETSPRPARRRPLWPLVGITGLAAAAILALFLVLPPSLILDVGVEAHWPRTTRGSEAPPDTDPGDFTVHVSTSKPAFVHVVALMEPGDLWIRPVTEDGAPFVQVAGETSLGAYVLWRDPDGKGLRRSTHVMVIAAQEPIMDELANALPDRVSTASTEEALAELEELARSLEGQLDCVVIVRPIEPSEP